MSVDQDAERSMLERKDRADLVTMATALGEKPPARAKKADIVDLILRVTNVASTEAAAVAAAASPASGGRTGRTRSGGGSAASASAETANAIDGERGSTSTDGESEAAAVGQPEPEQQSSTDGEAAFAVEAAVSVESETEGNARSDSTADADTDTDADMETDDSEAQPPSSTSSPQAHEGGRDGDTRVPPSQGAETRAASVQNRGDQTGRSTQSGPDRAMPRGNGQNGQGQAGAGQANQNRGGQGNQHQANQNQANQSQANQSQANQSQANQSQGPRLDDSEPGNRRRRRRGRDRERGPATESDDTYLGEPIDVEGLLDLRDEGFGFLRLKGFFPSKDDVYVSVKQVRQFGLRKGDRLEGKSRAASRNEKNPALLQIDAVNGAGPDKARQRPRFEDLTPLFPDEKLHLEMADDPGNMTARIVDLIAPIGKGQRGLIVSPPKAGKTTVMKQIARSLEKNNPEVHLIVLLVDERPEEVTDMRRWLLRGEVAASTFDRPAEEHTALAELVIERAKRMVEEGKDVVIILDGITRLARAYNLSAPATGRIMSGGIDAGALYPPKRFFGAARNVEEGGSLTILATALVETNSRMDDHIFEEFKGTGNMELKLDRKLADRRIYPAIDVDASSTRREELLFPRRQLEQVWRLRRVLSGLSGEGASGAAGLELLIDRMKTFKSNDEFLAEVAKAAPV
jgi:transcription termination factor Rho